MVKTLLKFLRGTINRTVVWQCNDYPKGTFNSGP